MTDTDKIIVRAASAPADFGAVWETLAAGFFNDPFISYVFPDPGRRAQFLPTFFSIYSEGMQVLIAGVSAGDCDGAVVQSTPGNLDLRPETLKEVDEKVLASCGQDAPTIVKAMTALSSNHPDLPPHFYLFFIAVRPRNRGRTTGLILLDHLAEQWDREGAPAYGEASTTALVTLYERRIGAKRINSPICIPNGPTVFPMLREPGAKPAVGPKG